MSDLIPSACEVPSDVLIALHYHDILLDYFEEALTELLNPLGVDDVTFQQLLGLHDEHVISVLLELVS